MVLPSKMVLSDCPTAKVINQLFSNQTDVKPVYVEMYFQRGSYYFSLVYKVHPPPKRETDKVVAIDMGEIHPIVSHDGEQTIIYNGRALRAIKQYINKLTAYIQSKMDRCKQRSNRWYRLRRIKTEDTSKVERSTQGRRTQNHESIYI